MRYFNKQHPSRHLQSASGPRRVKDWTERNGRRLGLNQHHTRLHLEVHAWRSRQLNHKGPTGCGQNGHRNRLRRNKTYILSIPYSGRNPLSPFTDRKNTGDLVLNLRRKKKETSWTWRGNKVRTAVGTLHEKCRRNWKARSRRKTQPTTDCSWNRQTKVKRKTGTAPHCARRLGAAAVNIMDPVPDALL